VQEKKEHEMSTATKTADAARLTAFLTEREVSELTGIAVKTLQRWRLQGVGPAFKKLGGTAVRYARNSVESWIAAQPDGGGKAA
jgi:predicted DNA-binding transcriptional regulator AlpA